MIGTKLNDRYNIEKRLGKGAFGEVFLAFDLQLKRNVAIKLLIDPGHMDSFKERFLRESEAMASMMHPHIATIFDFGEVDDRPYLVMEFVDGNAALQVCDTIREDTGQILRISCQVCRAMEYAHKAGIVHRDLTLRNILVDHEGEARVLDFGLAKLVHAEIQSDPSVVVGTPTYLSPEQAAGRMVDHRADIFAFGVCLYRMLIGRFPFEADHPASLMYLIRNEDPSPMPRETPVDLQDVVLKCLEKQPDNRYQSFAEVEVDLESVRKRYSDSEPQILAGHTPRETHAERGSNRNPYLNRVMIKNPDDFVGRRREVKRIYARLDAPRPQSISIVGERRMGKSSLLNFLYQRRNRRLNMENYHDSVFVYMDFQRFKEQDIDMAKFIDILFNMFNYETGTEISATTGERTLDALSYVVEKMTDDGKRIIMLMDEFEAITTNPNFEMKFFSFLRYLANNFRVAYVTSSFTDLQQLCHDQDIADSPFFNIFSNLQLRPFSRAEAMELVGVPSEREGISLEPHAERILQLSGLFPFFIQVACSNVFESLAESDTAQPDWNEIDRLFMEEARPHFTFIWDQMEEPSRENLSRIAEGKSVDRKYHHFSEDLQRRGYLTDTDGKTAPFSEPFRRFVLEQVARSGESKGLFSSIFGKRGKKA